MNRKPIYTLILKKRPRHVDAYDIAQIFQEYGNLYLGGVRFPTESHDPRAFIEFTSRSSARRAFDAVNGQSYPNIPYFRFELELSKLTAELFAEGNVGKGMKRKLASTLSEPMTHRPESGGSSFSIARTSQEAYPAGVEHGNGVGSHAGAVPGTGATRSDVSPIVDGQRFRQPVADGTNIGLCASIRRAVWSSSDITPNQINSTCINLGIALSSLDE